MGITERSANRLILRLEQENCVTTIGKISGGRGTAGTDYENHFIKHKKWRMFMDKRTEQAFAYLEKNEHSMMELTEKSCLH